MPTSARSPYSMCPTQKMATSSSPGTLKTKPLTRPFQTVKPKTQVKHRAECPTQSLSGQSMLGRTRRTPTPAVARAYPPASIPQNVLPSINQLDAIPCKYLSASIRIGPYSPDPDAYCGTGLSVNEHPSGHLHESTCSKTPYDVHQTRSRYVENEKLL